MAKTNAILAADRSSAATAALAVLCASAVVQLALLGQGMVQHWRQISVSSAEIEQVKAPAPSAVAPLPTPQALPPLPALPAPPSSTLPALPSAGGALPPLPALPSAATTVAPKPALPRSTLAAPVPFSSASLPVPAAPSTNGKSWSTDCFPSQTAPVVSNKSAPTVPKTGNTQVDELIEVAAQSRELNDPAGALQALERADLILPDSPVVLREKAMTFGKLGQPDKAQAMWDRVAKLGPGAGAVSSPSEVSSSAAASAPATLNDAFASIGSGTSASPGPLSLGHCEVVRDAAVTRGQKMLLKVPVKAAAGTKAGVNEWNLDVLFYDRVNGSHLEPTNADPVVMSFDMPVDFATGEEVVTAVYHMPELTPAEIANLGRREYGGYVIKLYYRNRLMSTAASPRDLLKGSSGAGAGDAAPLASPLLPPLPK